VTIEFRENPLLIVLMFGAAITRLLSVLFSVYLLLWIQSFVKAPNGQPMNITKPPMLFFEYGSPVL
jgi:hypothetical protein